jgi:hypothetical protein
MTFYILNCSTDKSLYGVTDDPIGANLSPVWLVSVADGCIALS